MEKIYKNPRNIILLHMCTVNEDHIMWFLRHKGTTDVILGHFLPFDPPNNPKNQNFEILPGYTILEILWLYTCVPQIIWCTIPQLYDVWFLRYGVQQTIFCHLGLFFAVLPLQQPGKSKFETMNKMPGDIITLHMCTIKENYMIYGSWDKKRDRHNFLQFWGIFCPFNPLITHKIKILKK